VLGPAFESRSLSSTSYNTDDDGPLEKKPNLQRVSRDNSQILQPNWHFLTDNNTTLSFPALNHQKTISNADSDPSLRLLISGRKNYLAHSRSLSLRSSIADSSGRTIAPISEFDHAVIVEPESILQKSSAGMSNTNLHRYGAPSYSDGSLGFPQFPCSSMLRQLAVQTIASATPSKDQLLDTNLRNSNAFNNPAQAVFAPNISSSRRGSFGVRLISASPEETLDNSGGQAGYGYNGSFFAKR